MRRRMLGKGGAKPFHPTDLDVKVLLMANNPANFILATGSLVHQWHDLSGYNNYIDAATNSTRPTLSAGEVVFNGSQKLQTRYIDSNYITELANATETSQFVVFRVNNVSTAQILLSNANSTFSFNPDMYVTSGNLIGNHRPGTTGTVHPVSNSTYYIAETDWELAGTSPQRLFVDGILEDSGTGATDLIGTNYEISVGARPRNLNNPLSGAIKAILIFNQKLNDSDRQKVEGWLAHELGMTSNLPIGHPYKISTP